MDMNYSAHYTHNYIEGNVYAITGAGSGFGREVALEILKMGGMVVINDYLEGRLNETVKLIEELGKADKAVAVLGNCADIEICNKMVAEAAEKFGKLDCFWANAGIMPHAQMQEHEVALPKWVECIETLMKGCLHGICASYDQFKAQGYGHFMVTSSISGNWSSAGAGVYSSCKRAVRFMAQCLRIENPGLIKVTVINPTGVDSTNLMSTMINPDTGDQIGQLNSQRMMQKIGMLQSGQAPEMMDPNSPKYWTFDTEDMSRSIMYALNQPKGVSIGEITVRYTNEDFIC